MSSKLTFQKVSLLEIFLKYIFQYLNVFNPELNDTEKSSVLCILQSTEFHPDPHHFKGALQT